MEQGIEPLLGLRVGEDPLSQPAAIELAIEGTVDVPLPGLMKMVVAPVVESEFEKLVDKYIANLIKKFGGEV